MKKFLNAMGLIVGVAMIIVGIVMITGYPTPSTDWVADAAFGADFYTYVYSAARAAANNAADIVHYIRDVVSLYGGLFFVFAGMLVILHYAKLLFIKPLEAEQTEIPADIRNTDDTYTDEF